MLCAITVGVVYVTVARGVTVGTIEVVNSTISFNTTQGTYQIVLAAQLPVFNPNYAAVGGEVQMGRGERWVNRVQRALRAMNS